MRVWVASGKAWDERLSGVRKEGERGAGAAREGEGGVMEQVEQPQSVLSPLPWRLQVCQANDVLHIVPAGDDVDKNYSVGMPMYGNRANAEFIVKACNSHHKLVAALKAMRCAQCGFVVGGPSSRPFTPCPVCAEARAVIARAEAK